MLFIVHLSLDLLLFIISNTLSLSLSLSECLEIGHKEARAYDFRNRGNSRDSGIQKHGRPQTQGGMGLLVVNPKEESGIVKIRNEFNLAEDLARDKVALAERGVKLVSFSSSTCFFFFWSLWKLISSLELSYRDI